MGKFKNHLDEADWPNKWWLTYKKKEKSLLPDKKQIMLSKKYQKQLAGDEKFKKDIAKAKQIMAMRKKEKDLKEGMTYVNATKVFSGPNINRGNLDRIVKTLKHSARFLYIKGKWYMWDGYNTLHFEVWSQLTRELNLTKAERRERYAVNGNPIEIWWQKGHGYSIDTSAAANYSEGNRALKAFQKSVEFYKLFKDEDKLIISNGPYDYVADLSNN